jgi:hypothetical protein
MKSIYLSLICCLLSTICYSQKSSSFFYGASASANFGRLQDRIEITPIAGYKILPKTFIGIGATLSYFSNKNIVYKDRKRKTTSTDKIWYKGGEVFLRFFPFDKNKNHIKNFYLQAHHEALWGNGKYIIQEKSYNYRTDNFTSFIGLGYKHPLVDRFSLGMMLAFKLNKEADSPYKNQLLRISFEF